MRYWKKTCAITLSAAMIIGMAAGNVSVAAGTVEKEETVYVNQEADGSIREITVSDWLKNVSGTGEISDVSELTDIKNVKGDETFTTGADGTLTWKAENADIYYQGKTAKELPVGVSVSYQLDGTTMKPSEMAGKSGKMTMTIQYENHVTYEEQINGIETKMNTPFLMASAVILPVKHFSNVEISQGKMVSEGSNQILVAYGVPGLTESLDVSGDLKEEMEKKLSDTVTITADVQDFSMKPIYTVATSEEFSNIELGDDSDMNDLENAVNDLVSATDELISGSSDLSDGLTALQDSFKTYSAGVSDLKKGALDLKDGAGKLETGVSQYTDGVRKITGGAGQFVTGTQALVSGVNDYVAGEKLIDQGAKTLKEQSAALPAGYSEMSKGLSDYIAGVNQIANADNAKMLAAGAQAVSDGISGVNAALCSVDISGVDYQTAIASLQAARAAISETDPDSAQLESIDAAIGQLQAVYQKQAAAAATIEAVKAQTSTDSELSKGAKSVAGAMAQLNESVPALVTGGERLKAADQQIAAGIKGVTDGISSLYDGIGKLSANNETLLSGADALNRNGATLTAGITALDGNTAILAESAKKLSKGASDLSNGVGRLNGATKEVSDGVGKLQDGSVDLLAGMNQFKTEGTGRLQNEYHNNIQNVLERFQSLTGEHANYKTYSGIADSMEGSVKFIFQTEEIKK